MTELTTVHSHVRYTVLSALYIALGVVLPIAFHTLPAGGKIFLPMHLCIYLCAMTCPLPYGIVCAVVTPLLSFLVSSMPALPLLPSMTAELISYSLIASLFLKLFRKPYKLHAIYISLIASMVIGRVIRGFLDALVFSPGTFVFSAWLTSSFVTALPGIVMQLAIVPALVAVYYKTSGR